MTTVRLFAAVCEAAGVDEVDAHAATLAQLEVELDERFGVEFARIRRQCSVMINGVRVEGDAQISAGVTVDLLPPFAGG